MRDSLIDLRSDTLTRPTPGMRAAMHAAEVGDDVFREDPTVNRLEERVAALLGKEAALFVPSGTMSNQIGIRAHTQPGEYQVLVRQEAAPNALCASLGGVRSAWAEFENEQSLDLEGLRLVMKRPDGPVQL